MFTNLLHKAIQVGEKVFHIFCDVSTSTADLNALGVEVIKVASQIDDAVKKQEAEKPEAPQAPADAVKEEPKQEA